jgi:hypothetical protein
MNRKGGTSAVQTGTVKIDGVIGDEVTITAVLSSELKTNAAGTLTFDGLYDALILDPFQMGGNAGTYASMYEDYCILGLELDVERTMAVNDANAKGKITIGLYSDPVKPLYDGTTDFEVITQMENSTTWDVNPSATGDASNLRLVYNNKERKWKKIFNDIDYPADFTKANAANIREAYQLALVAATKGVYYPASGTGPTMAYINLKMRLGLAKRCASETLVNLKHSVMRAINVAAASMHMASGAEADARRADPAISATSKGTAIRKECALLGYHVPEALRAAATVRVLQQLSEMVDCKKGSLVPQAHVDAAFHHRNDDFVDSSGSDTDDDDDPDGDDVGDEKHRRCRQEAEFLDAIGADDLAPPIFTLAAPHPLWDSAVKAAKERRGTKKDSEYFAFVRAWERRRQAGLQVSPALFALMELLVNKMQGFCAADFVKQYQQMAADTTKLMPPRPIAPPTEAKHDVSVRNLPQLAAAAAAAGYRANGDPMRPVGLDAALRAREIDEMKDVLKDYVSVSPNVGAAKSPVAVLSGTKAN